MACLISSIRFAVSARMNVSSFFDYHQLLGRARPELMDGSTACKDKAAASFDAAAWFSVS